MPTISFTGASFTFESIAQLNANSLSIRFSNTPVRSSSSGVHDSLNASLYTISGPIVNTIAGINSNFNDSNAVNITFVNTLITGLWTITGSTSIQSLDAVALSNPKTLSINIVQNNIITTNNNIVNDTSFDIIRKNFSESMGGPNWNAVMAALASGDDTNNDNTKLVFDQLFLATASSIYLNKLGADNGVRRPNSIGINDDNYRKLVIDITNNKLTIQSLLELLEIFYGTEATRAHAISGIVNNVVTNGGPYSLNDGDILQILINEKYLYNIIFENEDFQNINFASTDEIVNVINTTFIENNSQAFAVSQFEPVLNSNFIFIYSSSLGLNGSVRIVGGSAQNSLNFGNKIGPDTASVIWTISKFPSSSSPEKIRFTPNTSVDFSTIQITDYLNIYGSEFNSKNRGTYTITNLTPQWFEIDNLLGVAETITQSSTNDLLFYRPIKYTIQNFQRIASANQTKVNEIEVTLPVTSTIINRNLDTAGYLHTYRTFSIASISRTNTGLTTIQTSVPNGLSVGSLVYVDGATGSKINGFFIVTEIRTAVAFRVQNSEVPLVYAGSTPSTATLTVFDPIVENYHGPYIFDSKDGIGITATHTTTTQVLSQGSAYRQISVTDSSKFQDAVGYLVFAFGTISQVIPVRYLARPSNTSLLLDSTFVFPITIPSGSDVTLLVQKGTFVPSNTNSIGSCYITGSSAGRIESQKAIKQVVAGNVSVVETIQYPGDRGLGGEGFPVNNSMKLSDIVYDYAGDNVDEELAQDRAND